MVEEEEKKEIDNTEVEEGVEGEARIFLTYKNGDNESSSDGTNSNNKTPLPSRAP